MRGLLKGTPLHVLFILLFYVWFTLCIVYAFALSYVRAVHNNLKTQGNIKIVQKCPFNIQVKSINNQIACKNDIISKNQCDTVAFDVLSSNLGFKSHLNMLKAILMSCLWDLRGKQHDHHEVGGNLEGMTPYMRWYRDYPVEFSASEYSFCESRSMGRSGPSWELMYTRLPCPSLVMWNTFTRPGVNVCDGIMTYCNRWYGRPLHSDSIKA